AGLISIGVIAVDQVNRYLTVTKRDQHLPIALDIVVVALAIRFAIGAVLPARWRPRLPALDLVALAVCVALCIRPIFPPRPRADPELVAGARRGVRVEGIGIRKTIQSEWSIFVSSLGATVKFYDPASGPPATASPAAYLATKPSGRPGERKIGRYYLAVVGATP